MRKALILSLVLVIITISGCTQLSSQPSEKQVTEITKYVCSDSSIVNKAESCPEPEKKALVHAFISRWGYNIYDSTELIFDYGIYNFGDAEAKDIKVICKAIENVTETRFSFSHDYGNLASKQYAYGEFTPKIPINFDKNKGYDAICYVESCQNCEILYKRIPSLVEYAEK